MGKIVIGNASSASNNGGSEAPGDQGQPSGSKGDYKGEVKLREFSSQSALTSTYKGWKVTRPRDASIASTMAKLMITACNNANIGYKYGGKGMWCTGGSHKVNTKSKTVTDCSALVCECVSEAIGSKHYEASSGLASMLEGLKSGKKSLFYKSFTVGKEDVYNGDVISHSGHALMVVSGNPRSGQADEDPGTGSGGTSGPGPWMSGWGVTIYAAHGDPGQPNGFTVANPDVNFHATSLLDNKGFISVAAGKEWPFNTRFEIKELPGYVFQVDDRGSPKYFNGQKHLDIFVKDINKDENITVDGKTVSMQKWAGDHQWYLGKGGPLHVRTTSGGGGGGDESEGGTGSGYLEVPVEYSFIPRVKKVSDSDEGYKYYQEAYKKPNGKCFSGGYAWGRFCEVCHETCNVSTGAIKTWFKNIEDGYQRGASPSLGAIMCFAPLSDSTDPGFACVVEVVHENYIYVSYVDSNNKFFYKKLTQKNGAWRFDLDGDGTAEYILQGFIYPPNLATGQTYDSALHRFYTLALKYEGSGASFTKKLTGIDTKTTAWSTAFIMAVAREAGGIVDVIIPEVHGASSIGLVGTQLQMGTWFDGPALGGNPSPQIGDIALFRTVTFRRTNKYQADDAGIIVDVTTNDSKASSKGSGSGSRSYKLSVLVGELKTGVVKRKTYYTTSPALSGIYRPNWYQIDGNAEITKWITSPIGMYSEGTTIEDAAIRDVGYAKASGQVFEPSIKETGITLSAINYTGMLSNMYSVLASLRASVDDNESLVTDIWSYTPLSQFAIDVFATESHPASSSTPPASGDYATQVSLDAGIVEDATEARTGSSQSTSSGIMRVTPASRSIFNMLYSDLKNKGAVIGIMANMWAQSKWDPSTIGSNGELGLIKWPGKRATAMKKWCATKGNGQVWKSNLTGQITFLLNEASTDKKKQEGWEKLKKVSDDEKGSNTASDLFFNYFILSSKDVDTTIQTTSLVKNRKFCTPAWKLFVGDKK